MDTRQEEIYSDQWQRLLFSEAIMGSVYNFTFLSDIELIAPIVDCGSAFISLNDSTRAKIYYLARNTTDPQDVHVLTLAMAAQEYWIPSEAQVGSALVGSMTLINDLQSAKVDHHFIASLGYPFYKFDFRACELLNKGESELLLQLGTIPRNAARELDQHFHTAYRSGFYIGSETGRFNIRQQIWLLEDTPLNAIAAWNWKSKNTSRNMWAWVHVLDTWFGVYTGIHIIMQIMLIYRALSEGKMWAGDVSIPMAKPFMSCGTIALVFWGFTGFWEITELCLYDAHELVGTDRIFSFTVPMRLDVLYILQNYSGYLAKATRERIDTGLVYFAAIFSFVFRSYIIQLWPSVVATIKELAIETAKQELKSSSLGPMQLRAPYAIEKYPVKLMLYVLSPMYITVPLVVVVIILRKIYGWFNPRKPITTKSSVLSQATASESSLMLKSAYTNFELATGTQLESLYGMFSDFDNYVFVKGMRFASADGVYSAGFVIVNKKYLVNFNDIWPILLMKVIRVKHTNVYIFALDGTTVQQTARLVHPDTFTMRDLVRLGSSTLS